MTPRETQALLDSIARWQWTADGLLYDTRLAVGGQTGSIPVTALASVNPQWPALLATLYETKTLALRQLPRTRQRLLNDYWLSGTVLQMQLTHNASTPALLTLEDETYFVYGLGCFETIPGRGHVQVHGRFYQVDPATQLFTRQSEESCFVKTVWLDQHYPQWQVRDGLAQGLDLTPRERARFVFSGKTPDVTAAPGNSLPPQLLD